MKRLALIAATLLASCTGQAVHAQAIAQQTIPIAISTATTTQIITAAPSYRPTQITSLALVVNSADNVTLEYGTGTNCGTNTNVLSGAMTFGANGGIAQGSGYGAIIVVPPQQNFCIVTSASTGANGYVSYVQ